MLRLCLLLLGLCVFRTQSVYGQLAKLVGKLVVKRIIENCVLPEKNPSVCGGNPPFDVSQWTNSYPAGEPKVNGCGSADGWTYNWVLPHFEDCCNTHDRCYSECGNRKLDCDSDFRDCMNRVCLGVNEYKYGACLAAKEVAYGAVYHCGADAYLDAQNHYLDGGYCACLHF